MKANSPTIVTITSLTLLSLNCFMNYTLLLSTSHLKWEKLTKIIAHKKYLLFRAQAYPLPRTDDRRLSCFSNNELPVAGWKESDKFALYTVVHGIFLQLSKKALKENNKKKIRSCKMIHANVCENKVLVRSARHEWRRWLWAISCSVHSWDAERKIRMRRSFYGGGLARNFILSA